MEENIREGRRMQVLCIGSAVLDITARPIGRSSDWQEKQRIEGITFSLGGDAANQCIRMADAGLSVGILSAVGADQNGQLIRQKLEERGVDTDGLLEKAEYPSGTALILLDEEGQRTVFSVKGAYCELEKKDLPDPFPKELQAISIAGLFTEAKLEADGGLLSFLGEAKKRGIPVFADLANDKLGQGFDGIRPFLSYIDYFLPSLPDAVKMNRVERPEENAKIYRKAGCPNVLIKCGADGWYVSSDGFEGWVRAVPVHPLDTTGAGDSMVALFISRILKGETIFQACRYACGGATYSTLFAGASEHRITDEELQKWKAQKEDM